LLLDIIASENDPEETKVWMLSRLWGLKMPVPDTNWWNYERMSMLLDLKPLIDGCANPATDGGYIMTGGTTKQLLATERNIKTYVSKSHNLVRFNVVRIYNEANNVTRKLIYSTIFVAISYFGPNQNKFVKPVMHLSCSITALADSDF
jgi:hypothetical protein